MGVAQPREDVLALIGQPADRALGVPHRDEAAAQVVVLRRFFVGARDLLFEVDERGVEVSLDLRERLGVRQSLDRARELPLQFLLRVVAGASVLGTEDVHQSES